MNIKPIILLSEYQSLRELIKRNPKEGKPLSDELDRAIVIKKEESNKKIIRIGSEVEFEVIKTKSNMKSQLVLPQDAYLIEQKISNFALLGIALNGFSKNDEVGSEMPGSKMLFNFLYVSNEHLDD